MTVGLATPRVEYLEDGVTHPPLPIPYQFFDDVELTVYRITGTADSDTVILTLGADYSVLGGHGAVGSVTMTGGGIDGATLRIDRNTLKAQLAHYEPGDDFPAAMHEEALDRLEMQIQELLRDQLTAEDVRDLVGELLQAGDGIAIAVDDEGNTITISNTYDAEFIRDTIAAALRAGAGITIDVDDLANTITISATQLENLPDCVELCGDAQTYTGAGGVGTGTALTGEDILDLIASALAAGTGISVAYNDAANTITISNTAPETGGGLDAEGARDAIGAALHNGNLITITVNDAGDTITVDCDGLAASYRGLGVIAKAAAFNFDDTHGGKSLLYTGSGASATLRPDAVAALSDGWGTVIRNTGTGALTIALGAGVELFVNGATVSAPATIAIGGVATINRWGVDEFTIVGPKVNAG